MHAKFPFYSVAQMYAFSRQVPVSILHGCDNMYWVVDQHYAAHFIGKGFSLLHAVN